MKRKTDDELDNQIERSYYRQCAGTLISVLDIPRLFADVRRDVIGGQDLDGAVLAAIQRFNVAA